MFREISKLAIDNALFLTERQFSEKRVNCLADLKHSLSGLIAIKFLWHIPVLRLCLFSLIRCVAIAMTADMVSVSVDRFCLSDL